VVEVDRVSRAGRGTEGGPRRQSGATISASVAERYPTGMMAFWDPDKDHGFRFPYSESERDGGETKKQAGLYVDRAGDLITSPMDIPEGQIWLFVTLVARGIEMHLSEDRTRHQSTHPGEPLDMAEYLHVEIFPLAWPENFDALMADAREQSGVATATAPGSVSRPPSRRQRPAGLLRRRSPKQDEGADTGVPRRGFTRSSGRGPVATD
jgi:hypothetical protein